MRVGIYGVNVPEAVGGGFVLYSELIRTVLQSKGSHQFELIGASADAIVQAAPKASRQLARLAPALRRASRALRARQLEEDIRRKRIEMIWNLHMAPLDVGVPYITSILDLEFRLYPWFPELSAKGEWEYREQATAAAVHRASIIIAGSDTVKNQIHDFYRVPLARIEVLPFPTPRGAIEAATVAPDPERERLIRSKYRLEGPFLFYPAQFWAHKNHVTLLHALRLLRDRDRIPFSLIITGSDHGNMPHVRKTVSELGLDDFVRIPGFVPRDDIIDLYRSAFALTFVSFHGPENLPILEAQALGCPAVLSDLVGMRALYGDGPVLVDPRSEASIADGVMHLYRDPQSRNRAIEAGRATARSYTWERYVTRIYDLLDGFEPIRRCWPAGPWLHG